MQVSYGSKLLVFAFSMYLLTLLITCDIYLLNLTEALYNGFLQTVHHNAYHEDPYAREFGIKISEKLASVEARILPAPWVYCLLHNLIFVVSLINFSFEIVVVTA